MLALTGLMAALNTEPARVMKKMRGVSSHSSRNTHRGFVGSVIIWYVGRVLV